MEILKTTASARTVWEGKSVALLQSGGESGRGRGRKGGEEEEGEEERVKEGGRKGEEKQDKH